ncbi:MAG: NYN domain-containing protein [Phycisphaerae bacterium]|nr:NYN domain-containing protein [Phycisphaerae bacterium]
MPVVIDGNNLLYAARDVEDPALLIGRSMLCDTLGKWARRYNEEVHVVFDGPSPSAPLAAQIGHPDIQVTYSGAGISADAIVIDILETHSAARRMVVVSTDHDIIRVAKRRRAKSVRSEEFWAALKKDLARPLPKRPEPEEKEAGLSSEATQRWLEEFGLNELPEKQPNGFEGVDQLPRPRDV